MIRAVEGDKMLIVVDGDDHIKAAAAVFEYGMDGEHREAGATLVHPQLRGYKLQRTLLQIRFLGEEILDPNFKTFFSLVRKDNVASLHNLRSIGFIERTPLIRSSAALRISRGAIILTCPDGAGTSMRHKC